MPSGQPDGLGPAVEDSPTMTDAIIGLTGIVGRMAEHLQRHDEALQKHDEGFAELRVFDAEHVQVRDGAPALSFRIRG